MQQSPGHNSQDKVLQEQGLDPGPEGWAAGALEGGEASRRTQMWAAKESVVNLSCTPSFFVS